MAYQVSARNLRGRYLRRSGSGLCGLARLNTPDGELMAAAVELLTPPPYQVDAKLLADALRLLQPSSGVRSWRKQWASAWLPRSARCFFQVQGADAGGRDPELAGPLTTCLQRSASGCLTCSGAGDARCRLSVSDRDSPLITVRSDATDTLLTGCAATER